MDFCIACLSSCCVLYLTSDLVSRRHNGSCLLQFNGNTKYVALFVPRYVSCSSLRVETQSCQVVLFLIRMVRGRRKNRLFRGISCWKSAGQLVASCLALHDQKTMRNITLTDSGNASSPNATTFCPRASLPSVEYSLLFSCHRCLVCLTNRKAFVVLFR